MYFAWKDENFLIKILTTIMIFIVVIMIAISPAFASSTISISGTDYNLSETISQFDYLLIERFEYESSYYYVVVVSDKEFNLSVDEYGNGIFNFSRYKTGYLINTYYHQDLSLSDVLLSDNLSNFTLQNIGTGTTWYHPDNIIYSSFDVYDTEGNLVFPAGDGYLFPSFVTSDEDLASGNFQTLKIDSGDFDSSDSEDINFGIFDITGREFGLSTIEELPNLMVYSTKLNFSSKYLVGENGGVFYYIPQSDLGIDFSNGKQYYFVLANNDGERFDQSIFTVGGLTPEEELQNKQDQTNQKLDEANETNKGIWETIKDILSYINPFSENFFVYKLIELLVDAIKSLFIPSDDFFSTYFTNLQNWFSDRLGFLFYPFELIINILNDMLNINFSEPQFTIPDINEPFTGSKLICSTTFNFNDLLNNNVWNTVHNIYLILVDVAIVFGLVNLFHKKYEEVTTK